METPELKPSPLATKTSRALSDLSEKGVKEISASLQELLADVFALYAKTKNFHCHDRSELPRLRPPAGWPRRPNLRDDRRRRGAHTQAWGHGLAINW
jgi:hypothetical protein